MHRAVCLSLFLIAPLSFLIAPLSAQAPPEFEVASLKPNTSGGRGFSIVPLPGGKLNATNITLKRLIAVAYSVTDFQIFGNVPWLESDRYDMEARAPGPAPLPQLRLMPRTLLEDRFKLTYHRETREMKIYSLTQVKPGTFGPGLVEIPNGECSAESTQQPALANGTPCDVVNMGAGRINGQRGRMSQLCDRLSTLLAVTVVDKTGLQGNYNISMTWAPDPDLEHTLIGDHPPASDVPGPSVFTAVQEQLGLKLVAGKGPVEAIVIDSVEKASGN
jgi:uncharacterized protein (TIGR03435 family)